MFKKLALYLKTMVDGAEDPEHVADQESKRGRDSNVTNQKQSASDAEIIGDMTAMSDEITFDELDSREMVYIIHKHHNQWIKNIDQRAYILGTGLIAFLGFFINQFPSVWGRSLLVNLLIISTFCFAVIAIVLTGYTIFPKLVNPEKIAESANKEFDRDIIYWELIQAHHIGPEEYADYVLQIEDEEYTRRLAENIYTLSRIATRKYKSVRYGILFAGLMILTSIILLTVLRL